MKEMATAEKNIFLTFRVHRDKNDVVGSPRTTSEGFNVYSSDPKRLVISFGFEDFMGEDEASGMMSKARKHKRVELFHLV